MTLPSKTNMDEQRQLLRNQLHEQRIRIAQHLESNPVIQREFPRSMTMRFLYNRPAFVMNLLSNFAGLLLNARVAQSLIVVLVIVNILRAHSGDRTSGAIIPQQSDNNPQLV